MNLQAMIQAAQQFTIANAPTILTAAGITGTVTTAYLTGRASVQSHTDIKMERLRRSPHPHDYVKVESLPKLDRKETFLVVWKNFIPPAIAGAVTIGSIFWANRISANRMAGVAAAYALSERAFTEYKDKVREQIGENKNQAIHDEIAQDKVDREPLVDGGPIIIAQNGGILCFDQFTGRYFISDMENLRRSENDFKEMLLHEGYGSLTEFYGLLDIPSTEFSDYVGWNTDAKFSLVYSTVLSDDNRPCISIIFDPHPEPNFDKFGF